MYHNVADEIEVKHQLCIFHLFQTIKHKLKVYYRRNKINEKTKRPYLRKCTIIKKLFRQNSKKEAIEQFKQYFTKIYIKISSNI